MTRLFLRPALLLLLLATAPASAQTEGAGAGITFGGLQQDSGLPVEVTSDSLAVDQADGNATFSGNVVVSQGAMTLTAASVAVVYADGGGRIARMDATGGVTLVSGAEAAEAREARYDIDAGTVTMTGDVVLTQGQITLSSERLVVDLATGTGRLDGRVRSLFQPAAQ